MSKCKITVLRREYYQDLADQYLADPQVGKCPLFKEGQEFILERGNGKDDFWNMMNGKFCSEGCRQSLYLCSFARWLNYERLD